MVRLRLRLLGPMTGTLNTGQPLELSYEKVRGLLAFLAVESDREHSRARLAALFWPEKQESAARHSLSQALSALRGAIGDRDSASPLIRARKQSIVFDPTQCEIDVLEFQRELQASDQHRHESLARCAACVQRLETAVSLWRSDFLDGCSLEDAPEFEDWLRSVQESMHSAYSRALGLLSGAYAQRGEASKARQYGNNRLALDPLDEAAQRDFIRLLASTGGRSEAIRHFERFASHLERELEIEPEPETLDLVERIRSGLEGPAEPVENLPKTESASDPQPLPVPATQTIGREAEVQEILNVWTDDVVRLVTLVGPGGIGKTRLAIEVARSLQSVTPDGVHFVSLSGLNSADLLATAILDAIAPEVDRIADPANQLRSYLEKRNLLLVLDNFEHLLDGALLLSELLESAPDLRILVTSRERVSLLAESVYEVSGLSLPVGDDAAAVATSGACRLFMASARRHHARYLPSHVEAPAIARVARLTGGMPLALELAAAWVPVLSTSEIGDEIERSLDFLSSSMRDLPERHRSIRAVLDRLWENLTEVEQRAFRRLAVFQGGFSQAAASYVTGTSLPVLSALVQKSLLSRSPDGRYETHELLRQYGQMRLDEATDEADVVRDRFRDFYLGFLAVREDQLKRAAQVKVLGEITKELNNVRAAWQHAADSADFEGLGRAANAFWLYCEITGRYHEGASLFSNALEALSALEDPSAPESLEFMLARSRVQSRMAPLAFRMVGVEAMVSAVREALVTMQELEDSSEIGLLLNFQAAAEHKAGHYEEEERCLVESVKEFELAGDDWGLAYSKNDLGLVRALRGDYESAQALHGKALAILESYGDRRGIAFALRNLGIVARHLGNHERALELLRRSVEVRKPIGNRWGIAESLNQIGILLRDTGDHEAASEHFHEALQIARDIRSVPLAREILAEYMPVLKKTGTDGPSFEPGVAGSGVEFSGMYPGGAGIQGEEISSDAVVTLADAVLGVNSADEADSLDLIEGR